MTIELTTFPERWRLPLEGAALVDPVRTGKLLVVADMNHLRAVDAADGAAAWSLDVHDEIAALVAIDAGVVIAVAERAGHRVLMIDHAGKTGWELRERWNVTSQGLASSGDRVLLSGAPRTKQGESTILELSAADGAVIRTLPGWTREAPIAIADGWAWVEVGQGPPALRVLDGGGDRILATGEFRTLATAAGLIVADADGRLCVFDVRAGLRWERPGGAALALAVDADGIACARDDGDATWIVHYDLDGNQRWEVGPVPEDMSQ